MSRDKHWRRQQKLKMAKRVKQNYFSHGITVSQEFDADLISLKLADNRKPCSCYMCANPHKMGIKTKREIQEDELWSDYEEYK